MVHYTTFTNLRVTGDFDADNAFNASALPVTATGSTTARTLADHLGAVFNVANFGAAGVNGVDYTTQIQAAITAAEAVNGVVYFPPGTYYHSGLTVTPPVTLRGDGSRSSVLYLKDNSNTSSITVSYVATGANFAPQHCEIEGLQINGNRTNQSSGSLIYLTDGTSPWTSTQYGMSVIMRNCYLTSAKEHGLYVGNNRNFGILDNVEVEFCDGDGLRGMTAGDWRLVNSDFGGCNYGVQLVAGFEWVFTGCNIYSNTLYGLRIQPTTSTVKAFGCSFDRNGRYGVSVEGNTTATQERTFTACTFNENSASLTNTYSDILALNEKGARFIGCLFNRGSITLAKYLVEFSGTNGPLGWISNSYETTAASEPWGTALTNDYTKLMWSGDATVYVGPYGGASTSSTVIGGTEISRHAASQITQYKTVEINGTNPRHRFKETDAASNAKIWCLDAEGGVLRGFTLDDTESGATTWLNVTRSGSTVSSVHLGGASGAETLKIPVTASQVNRVEVTGAATGNAVSVAAAGSDTNINLKLTPKGTGSVQFGTHTASADTAVSGYITIVDAGGTTRKLAVIT